MVVHLSAVVVKVLAAEAADGQGMGLAQENRAGVELVAAQLGHQAGAGAVVEPPADQLLQALVAVLREVDVLIFLGDVGLPAVEVDDVAGVVSNDDRFALVVELDGTVVVLGVSGGGVVAVPQGADVADRAEAAALHEVIGVVVEGRVVALVADGQNAVFLSGDAAHGLALANGVGHQLFGEDVLAGVHRLDGDRGVQPQGQRDDHRLDVGVGDHLLGVVVGLEGRRGVPRRSRRGWRTP